VDIVSLGEHIGRSIRVGGLVSEVLGDGFALDDGTAVGRIRLTGTAAEYVALLEAGDAVNVTGRVVAGGGGLSIVVDAAAGLVRAGDPGDLPPDSADATGLAVAADGQSSVARPGDLGTPPLAGGLLDAGSPGEIGIVGVVLASIVSIALAGLRRYRTRRRLARRMAARLATFDGAPASGA
jgi:hypothetical protein